MVYAGMQKIEPEQHFKVIASRTIFGNTILMGVSTDELPSPYQKGELAHFSLGKIPVPEEYMEKKVRLTKQLYSHPDSGAIEERYIFQLEGGDQPQEGARPDGYSIRHTGILKNTIFGDRCIKRFAGQKINIGDVFSPREYLGKKVEFIHELGYSEGNKAAEIRCRMSLLE